MKKSKIMIPALGILVLSTAASITGTVAWFTAANSVDIDGFAMQAQAEQGIVVSNEAKSQWKTSASASHDGKVSSSQATFVPTSTSTLTTWYHANAADANSYAHTGSYVTKTPSQVDSTGVYQMDISSTSTANNQNIYLLNKFYIQSSSATAITGQDLYIKDLVVTPDGSSSSELNKTFRIGILCGSTFGGIYAPITGADASYTVNGATDVTAITSTATEQVISGNAGVTIPAFVADGTGALEVSVFAYFEGEDENCKSANIQASMDTLSVTFKIGNKTHTNA